MPNHQITRRLAAVLAADVVGYSSMMELDESATLAALRQIWTDTFNPSVAAHHGRIVKMMGDGVLVEFASVVEAVECAAAIQGAMSERNSAVEQRVEFRMGINLGEIVIEGDDIFGDGVNVAARLEAHAPPGGILASDAVHCQTRGKVRITFVDAGEVNLKNLKLPVRVWRWDGPEATRAPRHTLALVKPAVDKPSIAVLPFVVMGGDPEQEFFADGLVEDILTTLSKLSGLSVIARNSSFVYKGRAVDVRQVAQELGVRFVLEGSVRKTANRIRITTQLIDATTGVHIWAERFDRGLEDMFAVQDEITLILATEMQVNLTEGERVRLRYTTTTNIEAWNIWIEALKHEYGHNTSHVHVQWRRCLEKALVLDPGSAPLNAALGNVHFSDARHGWTGEDRETSLRKAEAYVARALEIDPQNPDAYRALSGVMLLKSRFEEAAAAARKAVKFGPSLPDVLVFAAFVLCCSGGATEAVYQIEKALTLGPKYPAWFLGVLGNAYRLSGRSDKAEIAFQAYHEREPGYGLADIIMIQEQAGHLDQARQTAVQLAERRPTFTVASYLRTQFRYDTVQLAADVASLRAAGVPEG